MISVALAIFLLGCSDDTSATAAKKEEILKQVNTVKQSEPAVVEESVEAALKEDVATVVKVAEETTVEVVAEATKKVEEEKETVETVVASKSGADLFKSCSSCHGVNAEKKALNKSQVVQGWDAAKIASALHGYKDGSYGGAMKGLMKSQVTKLSDEDINVLSQYISEL